MNQPKQEINIFTRPLQQVHFYSTFGNNQEEDL